MNYLEKIMYRLKYNFRLKKQLDNIISDLILFYENYERNPDIIKRYPNFEIKYNGNILSLKEKKSNLDVRIYKKYEVVNIEDIKLERGKDWISIKDYLKIKKCPILKEII